MNDSGELINAFRENLLRWNSQINLVSRQETSDRLEGLFSQCVGGASAIIDHFDLPLSGELSKPEVLYFDLGSGGGLPGVLWHVLFSNRFDFVKTWLVEPREKRAWFLKRLNRISGMPAFGVLHGRWGEVFVPKVSLSPFVAKVSVVVISLKALHLDDPEVIKGLSEALSPLPCVFELFIARYYPPEQVFDAELEKLLNLPSKGAFVEFDDHVFLAQGGSIVPLSSPGVGLASLVLSSYAVSLKG